MRILLLILLLSLSGCTQRIQRPGAGITFKNGRLLYKGKIYSGIVVERFDSIGTVRETHYQRGLPNGDQDEYFEKTMMRVAHREFTDGKNTGVHEGWFLDGKRRFHYEYNKAGISSGEFWEWYNSGPPSLFARFDKGRLIGKKVWREDGQIYINNVFTETRAWGVRGTKLCLQVRDDKPRK